MGWPSSALMHMGICCIKIFLPFLLKCGSEFARHVERQVGDAVGNGKVGGVQHVGG